MCGLSVLHLAVGALGTGRNIHTVIFHCLSMFITGLQCCVSISTFSEVSLPGQICVDMYA